MYVPCRSRYQDYKGDREVIFVLSSTSWVQLPHVKSQTSRAKREIREVEDHKKDRQRKVFADKSHDLRLILRACMVEGENRLLHGGLRPPQKCGGMHCLLPV